MRGHDYVAFPPDEAEKLLYIIEERIPLLEAQNRDAILLVATATRAVATASAAVGLARLSAARLDEMLQVSARDNARGAGGVPGFWPRWRDWAWAGALGLGLGVVVGVMAAK